MDPFLKQNSIIGVVGSFYTNIYTGDVVVVVVHNKLVIKRIAQIENGMYELRGDNIYDSYDSRVYGRIRKKDIVAKLLFKI